MYATKLYSLNKNMCRVKSGCQQLLLKLPPQSLSTRTQARQAEDKDGSDGKEADLVHDLHAADGIKQCLHSLTFIAAARDVDPGARGTAGRTDKAVWAAGISSRAG
jgi:hypothetical protein